ncbi:DUF2326 domain-containing protein [Levilactobacillus namurensis]|uniref:DUF2326 domain-containing protein n=1 Tax=Levilactobacillus namurensis TaxID=380393 RepID=UPI00222F12D4|nr:DUF2326 domain-containing protein [Levilactobacillus namurensis]MCW3779324.1 DUF2326 domain-containing protein [Levilactobacillus namurensis]
MQSTKRIKFVGKDLPNIQEHISAENMELRELRRNIDELTEFMSRTDASKRLDKLSEQLGVLHEDKGKTVEKIEQIDKSNNRIQELNKNLKEVDQSFFSSETKVKINNQLSKFNKYFANISQQLYGEQYGVAFEVKERNGQRNYDFYVFAYNNSSSGKKQGEVAAFDIGYILFARHEQIPVLDFVLYDKKELMYGGQLLKISEEAEQNDIQVIFPILSDKLPEKLNNDDNIVLYLSEDDKLFRF